MYRHIYYWCTNLSIRTGNGIFIHPLSLPATSSGPPRERSSMATTTDSLTPMVGCASFSSFSLVSSLPARRTSKVCVFVATTGIVPGGRSGVSRVHNINQRASGGVRAMCHRFGACASMIAFDESNFVGVFCAGATAAV